MNKLNQKQLNTFRRANRVRSMLSNNSERLRLSVNVSNLHVSAQIIDDTKGVTLAYATTVGHKVAGSMTEKAEWVGTAIAANAKKAKIKQVAFDRGARKYHGRIKALAEAARKGGLEF